MLGCSQAEVRPIASRTSGEMADALASGASVRKDVGVQVPPRALLVIGIIHRIARWGNRNYLCDSFLAFSRDHLCARHCGCGVERAHNRGGRPNDPFGSDRQ